MILKQIQDRTQFHSTELAIIDFILQSRNSIETMTLSQVSRKIFSSNSTVLRFCKKLGFKGFKDFKIQLIKEFSRFPTSVLDINLPFLPEDSILTIGNNLAQIMVDGLHQTLDYLEPLQLEKAVKIIETSNRFFLFGKGDSYICAENFKNKMMKLNRYMILAEDCQEGSYTIGNLTAQDGVLFCTYGAAHYDYLSYASVLKRRMVPTIIITSKEDTALAKVCDVILRLPDDENVDQKISNFSSQTNMEFLLYLLYSIIFQHNYINNYKEKHYKDSYTNKITSRK